MVHFSVEGPLPVPYYQGRASKAIAGEEARDFWEKYPNWASRRGCYIFAVRAGRGIVPAYVGRATKTFRQEVFTSDKLAKYQRALADYVRGTPVMFLVMSPNGRGKPNISIIHELEEFLIQTALSVNEDLLNVRGTKRANFAIAGVLRTRQGKPSSAAQAFKRSLNL